MTTFNNNGAPQSSSIKTAIFVALFAGVLLLSGVALFVGVLLLSDFTSQTPTSSHPLENSEPTGSDIPCPLCETTGVCFSCKGKGGTFSTISNDFKIYYPCSYCLSSGVCDYCEGAKYLPPDSVLVNARKTRPCSVCNGSGICNKCHGYPRAFSGFSTPVCFGCNTTGVCRACSGKKYEQYFDTGIQKQ